MKYSLTKLKEKAKDWNFDFAEYEQEDFGEDEVEDIKGMEPPLISGRRSRFSNGQAELENLAMLRNELSKYSIRVGSRTQDINELWKFYAIISEYWDCIQATYGRYVIDDMIEIKKKCKVLLNKYEQGTIPVLVHNNLLYYKSIVYKMAQFKNFRFEVERVNRGVFSSARRKIIQ